ncbi:MAG: DUF2235 domain-containing protein [Planctomycetaceae bacterium]|nr:DUF2235 domain-containing protein [Planctomycetaceae bacterium]
MSQKLILCFDGTSNKPEDAVEDRILVFVGDSGITNVLKLHLLFGGDLRGGQHVDGQRSFYFSGVGTRGSGVEKVFDTAFAPERLSLKQMTDAGMAVVSEHFQAGDELYLFGFSRGAAIARRFASQLPDNVPVRFLGVFDTVASFGIPSLKDDQDPSGDVIFENGTIAKGIREALHLVSIDETRKVFRPTLMNRDVRVTEYWLPGVHSDVGGGYRQDGLSDSALQIMLEEMDRRNLGIRILAPQSVPYDKLAGDNSDPEIDLDDVLIQPDLLGKLHEHKRPHKLAELTLAPRRVCVNENDQPSPHRPLIHWTAAERIYGDPDYRPRALRQVAHDVILPDGTRETFGGLHDHLQHGRRRLIHLNIGEERELFCNALRPNNHSGLLVVSGEKYLFTVPHGQQWTDFDTTCGPEGWTRESVTKGFFKESIFAVGEFFRRAPSSAWFALMGSVGGDDSEIFEILQHTSAPRNMSSTGEFCSFANDHQKFYSNNTGTLRFRIRRVE